VDNLSGVIKNTKAYVRTGRNDESQRNYSEEEDEYDERTEFGKARSKASKRHKIKRYEITEFGGSKPKASLRDDSRIPEEVIGSFGANKFMGSFYFTPNIYTAGTYNLVAYNRAGYLAARKDSRWNSEVSYGTGEFEVPFVFGGGAEVNLSSLGVKLGGHFQVFSLYAVLSDYTDEDTNLFVRTTISAQNSGGFISLILHRSRGGGLDVSAGVQVDMLQVNLLSEKLQDLVDSSGQVSDAVLVENMYEFSGTLGVASLMIAVESTIPLSSNFGFFLGGNGIFPAAALLNESIVNILDDNENVVLTTDVTPEEELLDALDLRRGQVGLNLKCGLYLSF
jgi:hypothetical protein